MTHYFSQLLTTKPCSLIVFAAPPASHNAILNQQFTYCNVCTKKYSLYMLCISNVQNISYINQYVKLFLYNCTNIPCVGGYLCKKSQKQVFKKNVSKVVQTVQKKGKLYI